MTTILLTGLPRSGTSLVCACLNTAQDVVALVEPMSIPPHGDIQRGVSDVLDFAERTRARLLATGVAPSAVADGVIPDNTAEEARADGRLRAGRIQVIDVRISKPLSPEFRLFIKHPGLFTALASPLSAVLPLYAVVRHPLAALASWRTVDMPIQNGHWPVAERFAPDLSRRLAAIDDPLERQAALIGWIFRVYRTLPRDRVLTYESIIADPGAALTPLLGRPTALHHPIRRFDWRRRYVGVDLARLAIALTSVVDDVEPFYPNFRRELADQGGRA